MSTLFAPFFQQVDSNGAPLSGAKLYFYQTGTSTLLDTYTTSGLTTPNANPVVADSNGRWGPIYLGNTHDYKVVLKDSADSTIATADPVFAASDTGRTAVNDVSYTATITDRVIGYTAITTNRAVTLPAANLFPAGTLLTIVDESGSVAAGKRIQVSPTNTDTINGANSTLYVVNAAYGSATLESDGTSKWTARYVTVPAATGAVLRSYLAGLTTSNNSGTPNTKIDVAAGVCADDTNAQMLALAATTLNCGTTGANGLDTGSLANSTWYHLFAIGKTDGTTALLASTSISSPTYPSGYTLKRRIGSFKTDGSAHILGFTQTGDEFHLNAYVQDVSATDPGTSAVTATLASVPTGVVVRALVRALIKVTSTATSMLLSALADNDQAPPLYTDDPAAPGYDFINPQGGTMTAQTREILTNTSAQIRYRLSASGADVKVSIVTFGWIDRRGRDS
jgi:hypothetical protein